LRDGRAILPYVNHKKTGFINVKWTSFCSVRSYRRATVLAVLNTQDQIGESWWRSGVQENVQMMGLMAAEDETYRIASDQMNARCG
jgi:hypothetical protein